MKILNFGLIKTMVLKRYLEVVPRSSIRKLLHIAAIASLFIGVFAGRFSLGRLFYGIQGDGIQGEWLQLRVLGIVFSAIFIITLVLIKGVENRKPSAQAILYLSCLGLLHISLILNAYFLGNAQVQAGYRLDGIIVLASFILAIFLFRSPMDLRILAHIAEATGIMLFTLAIAGFGNPELNGLGWAPIGGPITFYRIEFLAFCSALYLFATASTRVGKVFHLAVSTLALFATFMSLSKAPLVGATVVIAYFTFWLFSKRKYERLGFIYVVTIVSGTAFYIFGGAIIQARIEALDLAKPPSSTIAKPPTSTIAKPITLAELIEVKKIYMGDVKFESLSKSQQARIIALDIVLGGGAPDYRTDLPAFIRHADRMVVMYDPAYRLHLFVHAVNMFRMHKWFGGGIGNYNYYGINMYSTQFEEYKYPHNILLEILFTNGLVGLAFFAITLLIAASLMQRVLFRHDAAIFYIGYVIFVFVTSLFSGDIYDFRLFWFVALVLILSHLATSIKSSKVKNGVSLQSASLSRPENITPKISGQ